MSPKLKYILINGLSWGLLAFLGLTVLQVLLLHQRFTWFQAALSPIWLGCGISWANSMWNRVNRNRLA